MREYWEELAQGVGVARATGLQSGQEYLDDFRLASEATGFVLVGRVLDIGCGTGRLAVAVVPPATWLGVDIAPSMVAHAQALGRDAILIEGPESLSPMGLFDRVLLLSVFTHTPREVRQSYLKEIAALLATGGEVLLTFFAGHEGGSLGFTSSNVSAFRADIEAAGLTVLSEYRLNWDGTGEHTFYRLGLG